MGAEKEIGRVTHWYDKLGVAVLGLQSDLKLGDRLRFRRGGEEFEETVNSMQVKHQDVTAAGKGDDVAVKLTQRAKEGALVYKVE